MGSAGDARMSTRMPLVLMLRRVCNQAVWVSQQNVLAWFGFVLGVAGYVFIMIKILS
jgi:hypothetical protein